MRLRSEMVEKTLMGYKEMCNDLEKELKDVKSKLDSGGGTTSVDGLVISSADNFDCCERMRRDLERVRTENERLCTRNDELDLILEQHNIKGAYEIEKFKVTAAYYISIVFKLLSIFFSFSSFIFFFFALGVTYVC